MPAEPREEGGVQKGGRIFLENRGGKVQNREKRKNLCRRSAAKEGSREGTLDLSGFIRTS